MNRGAKRAKEQKIQIKENAAARDAAQKHAWLPGALADGRTVYYFSSDSEESEVLELLDQIELNYDEWEALLTPSSSASSATFK